MKFKHLLFISLIPIFLQAQDTTFIAPDLSIDKYIYGYNEGYTGSLLKVGLGEELEYEGKTYIQLGPVWDTAESIIRIEGNRIYARQRDDSDIVPEYFEEYILYDYGLEVGDIFYLYDYQNTTDTLAWSISDSVYVSEVSQVELNSITRRKIHLASQIGYETKHIWIEGLGNMKNGFFHKHVYCPNCAFLIRKVICAREYNSVTINDELFHMDWHGDIFHWTCDENGALGTINIEDIADLVLAPNPFSDQINIQMEDFSDLTALYLYTNTGQLLKELKPSPQLNLTDLNNGIYLLGLQTERGFTFRKIVKQ